MKLPPTHRFQSVQESRNPFLSLWSHRYDFLQAKHPNPGESPQWKTENHYPLSDRLILQGAYLYGVRFGKTTNYALLDIDACSAYHHKQDSFAIQQILDALEPLGITHSIDVSSSDSGGIHFYLPFSHPQKCHLLASAILTLLEAKGFKVAPGQLELFPNARSYIPNSTPQLYNGHRLPLQQASHLLNEDWQPIYSSQIEFVKRWKFCQQQNQVQEKTIRQILKTYRRKPYPVTTRAAKFLNDLQTEIEPGWTGHGQTNWLLGRIAMREYIFGHILNGSAPLEGAALTQRIVEVAITLPGYTEWCRHQHEIYKRANEWARCVENSKRYFHYGVKQLKRNQPQSETVKVSWNQKQKQKARAKIQLAIADLLNQGILPSQTTKRFRALTQYGMSGATLYEHRDLWHPDYFDPDSTDPSESLNSLEKQAAQPLLEEDQYLKIEPEEPQTAENYSLLPTNLLAADGCNALQDNASSIFQEVKSGCNTSFETSPSSEQSLEPTDLDRIEHSTIDPAQMPEELEWMIFYPSVSTDIEPPFF